MLQYLVLNDEGDEVNPGDIIKDFRGDPAVFLRVTQGVEYNGVAKVEIGRWLTPKLTSEYYASVFNLKVQTRCGVPACGSVNHTTREHGAEKRIGT